MNRVNSKAKGGSFERSIAVRLSLWVSGHKRDDLFWRTASSGGRATFHNKSSTNAKLAHQAGDIAAIHPDGRLLLELFLVECKFWKSIGFDKLVFGQAPPFAREWVKLSETCSLFLRCPMLIGKQNFKEELVFLSQDGYEVLSHAVTPKLGLHVFAVFPQWRMVVVTLRNMLSMDFTRIASAVEEGKIELPPVSRRNRLDESDRYSRLASYRPTRGRISVGNLRLAEEQAKAT